MFKRSKFAFSPLAATVAGLFACAPAYAFDPNDPADAKVLEDAVKAATDALAAKNKQLLGELKTAKKGQEIDPAAYAALEQERDTLTGQLDEANKSLKAAQKAVADTTKALEGEQGFTQRLLVDNGLMAALGEAGVKNPVHLKAAAALIRSSAKVEVKVDGDARTAVVGDKSLGEFVKAWAASDDGKAFVTAPVNSGGNASGGGGGGGGGGAGNLGGKPAERVDAIKARFPELQQPT